MNKMDERAVMETCLATLGDTLSTTLGDFQGLINLLDRQDGLLIGWKDSRLRAHCYEMLDLGREGIAISYGPEGDGS